MTTNSLCMEPHTKSDRLVWSHIDSVVASSLLDKWLTSDHLPIHRKIFKCSLNVDAEKQSHDPPDIFRSIANLLQILIDWVLWPLARPSLLNYRFVVCAIATRSERRSFSICRNNSWRLLGLVQHDPRTLWNYAHTVLFWIIAHWPIDPICKSFIVS